jgi:putative ABC transport system ATP-binding protein
LLPDATSAPAASCVGVVKIYWTATGEVHALRGVDVLFPAGSVTAVVGPSGSGKSSLLRIIAGMDRATAGQVVVGGTDLSGLSDNQRRKIRRRLVGYVFQRPSENLVSYLTVREHLASAARLRSSDDDIDTVLENLGLSERGGHRPSQLSGGEQQRTAFAQAVVGRPALLVADEPTAELDHISGAALLRTVHELASTGVGVVVSTHDPQVVEAADRTYYLRHGALQSETTGAASLAVIDATGRVQLPPEALVHFPQRRAVLSVEPDGVRITPP